MQSFFECKQWNLTTSKIFLRIIFSLFLLLFSKRETIQMLVCVILSTCINSPYRCQTFLVVLGRMWWFVYKFSLTFPMHFLKYYLGEFKFDLQGPNASMQVVQVAWIFCCASLKKLILHEDSFSVVYCVRETRKKDEACYFKGNTFFIVLLRSPCWLSAVAVWVHILLAVAQKLSKA